MPIFPHYAFQRCMQLYFCQMNNVYVYKVLIHDCCHLLQYQQICCDEFAKHCSLHKNPYDNYKQQLIFINSIASPVEKSLDTTHALTETGIQVTLTLETPSKHCSISWSPRDVMLMYSAYKQSVTFIYLCRQFSLAGEPSLPVEAQYSTIAILRTIIFALLLLVCVICF